VVPKTLTYPTMTLLSALRILLVAIACSGTTATALQSPDVATPSSAADPSALELGVRLTRTVLDGALVAAQQMLALEQQTPAEGPAAGGFGVAGSVSTRIAGSAPGSAPSSLAQEGSDGTDAALAVQKRMALRTEGREKEMIPLEQQIQAWRVGSFEDRPSSHTSRLPLTPFPPSKLQPHPVRPTTLTRTGHHRPLHGGGVSRTDAQHGPCAEPGL
jgi:hypothetical protein